MNEESTSRLKQSQLAKLQDQSEKKKKDVTFDKLSTKQSERSRFSITSKRKSIKSMESGGSNRLDREKQLNEAGEILEDPEGELEVSIGDDGEGGEENESKEDSDEGQEGLDGGEEPGIIGDDGESMREHIKMNDTYNNERLNSLSELVVEVPF